MKTKFFRTIAARSGSSTFRRSFRNKFSSRKLSRFASEELLLDWNMSRWIAQKTTQAVHISQETAAGTAWSLISTVPINKETSISAQVPEYPSGHLSQEVSTRRGRRLPSSCRSWSRDTGSIRSTHTV